MKKIIPLLAVALAMAVPLTISAQTPDYYGFENPDKTTLIEWVEDAINAGNIDFDTQAHEDAFLDIIQDVYDYRDAENWSAIVTLAGQMKTATSCIEGTSHSDMVDWICEIVGWAYADETVLLLTPGQVTEIQAVLNSPPTDETLRDRDRTIEHVKSQGQGDWCHDWQDKNDQWHHIGICDEVKKVYYD